MFVQITGENLTFPAAEAPWSIEKLKRNKQKEKLMITGENITEVMLHFLDILSKDHFYLLKVIMLRLSKYNN